MIPDETVVTAAEVSRKMRPENCPWTLAKGRSPMITEAFLKPVMGVEDKVE